MNKEKLGYFRTKLLRQREAILNKSKKLKEDSYTLGTDGIQDMADAASNAYNADILMSLSDNDRNMVKEIDSALDKIGNETYGICEECEEPINEKKARGKPRGPLLHHVQADDRRKRYLTGQETKQKGCEEPIMIEDLILRNDNKIVLLVLDGLGDIPDPAHGHKTPLEAAKKPNMDALAMEKGVLGRTIPVGIGITPGSGPGHLSLFGYDPVEYGIGRGILEVLGLDMNIGPGDVTARGNFCTVRGEMVTDRRAGRIESTLGEALCGRLGKAIPEVNGVKVTIKPGVSHRFGIVFSGTDLSDELEDADPHKENRPFVAAVAKAPSAEKTAAAVNAFMKAAREVLKGEETANGVLLRGFSKRPDMPLFPERYGMESLAIATYPMYRGIAKLLGMKVERESRDYADMVTILREHYDKYQFFFMHIKETDVAGEDGNFDAKRRAIEAADKIIRDIHALAPKVFIITGDHSTPCAFKGHSWHPVPLLIVTDTGETDRLPFHERNCLQGSVGTMHAKELMTLALSYGLKLDKFGA